MATDGLIGSEHSNEGHYSVPVRCCEEFLGCSLVFLLKRLYDFCEGIHGGKSLCEGPLWDVIIISIRAGGDINGGFSRKLLEHKCRVYIPWFNLGSYYSLVDSF